MPTIQQIMLAAVAIAGPGFTWTGITGATESPTGYLTKTAAGATWGNCGAVSVQTMAGDCRLTIYNENYVKRFFVGIGVDSSCVTFSTVDFAYFANFGLQTAYESGSSTGNTATPGADNIMLEIERIGTNYRFYYETYVGSARPSPGSAGRTLLHGPTVGSGATIYVNAALFDNPNGEINAVNMLWTAL